MSIRPPAKQPAQHMTTNGMATVLLALDDRFDSTPDGKVWTRGAYSYDRFERYLGDRTQLVVAARVTRVTEADGPVSRADGPRVRFQSLEDYSTVSDFVRAARGNRRQIAEALGACDGVLLEVPSLVGTAVWLHVLGGRRSYGVEVLGDPNPLCATRAVLRPIRSAMRACARAIQKWQCGGAAAAIYTTREYLQQRYPCPGPTVAVPAADVAPEWFQALPSRAPSAHRLVGAGMLDDPAAGVNTLLFAISQCRAAGLEMSLTWIGDGPLRASVEALAGQLGVAPQVTFTGAVPAACVREILDAADLFVLPSRAGGATGTLFEALARGLPCIASRVGDVAEHVHPAALVEPGVAHKLARRLSRFVQDDKFRQMLADHSLAAREGLRGHDPTARRRIVERLCRQRQPATAGAEAGCDVGEGGPMTGQRLHRTHGDW